LSQHFSSPFEGFMERSALLEVLVERIALLIRPHPIRVAIDGVDGVGKTTLANELVDPLRRRGLLVIRASIDGFHNPGSVRIVVYYDPAPTAQTAPAIGFSIQDTAAAGK